MAYGTINADVIQSSVTGVSLGAGNATVFKNRIINGDMRIDQRNAGASGTAINSYTVDRWGYAASQSSKGTWQQNAGSVTPPVGYTNYLGFTSSSAYTVGASDYFMFFQYIEGYNVADLAWGTANAKTVTLSFQVYSSLTGTFGGSLNNSANTQNYPFSYSISVANTWTTISVTIAGSTTATWLTTSGIGLMVRLSLGAGSTYSGTAGSWSATQYFTVTSAVSVVGTNGATFYITGVQLEVGSSATGFEFRDFGNELIKCQRYYQQIGGNSFGGNPLYPIIGNGFAFSTTQCDIYVPLRVTMRTTPTITSSVTAVQVAATPYAVTSVADVGSTYNTMFLRISTAGTFVTGTGALWSGSNSATSYGAFSSEL